MKYWAFLSYSHTDAKWGDWLHKALETYRVPRRLIGKDSRDEKIPERLFPIFRDREELPVSADLGTNINEALEQSRYLIVICSPRSAQSRWVGEEIKTFKKLGGEDHILALIVDGEPNASDGKSGFKVEDECFHELMRYRLGPGGAITAQRTEPIAADAREGKDGKGNAKLKLLAGLLGVNYDDLKQREQERRLRRFRIVVAAALFLIAVFICLSAALLFKQREAARARDQARETVSKSDFFEALRLIDEQKTSDALAQLARSLRFDPNNQLAACRLASLLVNRNYPMPKLTLRHSNVVEGAEFSPDGKVLLTVAGDATITLWDTQTGGVLLGPMKQDDQPEWVEFSPNGDRFLIVTMDHTARVLDARSGATITGPIKEAKSLRFSRDGKMVLAILGDQAAHVLDAASGKAISHTEKIVADEYFTAELSPDSQRIITASDAGTARVWDASSGKPITEGVKNGRFSSAEFSPDGKRILTISGSAEMRLWDAQTLRPLIGPIVVQDFESESGEGVMSARFSPDGKLIAAGTGKTARIWNAQTGERLADTAARTQDVKETSASNFIHWVRFSPDSEQIVTGGVTRVWNARTGQPLTELMQYREAGALAANFSPDGRFVATAFADAAARLWDVRPGKTSPTRMFQGRLLLTVDFSPNGKLVVSCGDDVRVWNVETGVSIGEPIKYDQLRSAKFSPNGERVLTTSLTVARVWDAKTGQAVSTWMPHEGPINSAEFSPDGKRIITTTFFNTRIWSAESGVLLTGPVHNDGPISSPQFSSDGKRIVSVSSFGSQTGMRVLDSENGRVICENRVPSGWGKFSRDGKRILTASSRLQVWDSETCKIIDNQGAAFAEFGRLTANRSRVVTNFDHHALIWNASNGELRAEPGIVRERFTLARTSPDGARSVNASNTDVTIRDIETGRPLTDVLRHESNVTAAEFSPDGRRIVTATATGTLRVWDVAAKSTRCPAWLPHLADAMAGESLNENGEFQPIDNAEQILHDIKDQLAAEPAANDWTIWGRWFLADRSMRTISPFSKITVPEYIEDRIKESATESLDEAEELGIGNPRLLQRIKKSRDALSPTSRR